MGIDLKVMASYFRELRGEMLPTATLRLEREPRLFGQLALDSTPCLVHPLPDGLKVGSFDDSGLTFMDTDGRGNRLTFTTPGELIGIRVPPDLTAWNCAVLDFLRGLPPNSRVVLFWC